MNFFQFCEHFLSKIVGITFWKDNCRKATMSEMTTASNEAFAYVFVKKYWSTWSTVDLEKYNKESTFENGSVKKKGQQLLENTHRMHMVLRGLEAGQEMD